MKPDTRFRRRSKGKPQRNTSFVRLFGVILCLMMMLVVFLQRSFFGNNKEKESLSGKDRLLVEHEGHFFTEFFPSLKPALTSSEIVLLYFAAAWCPMSTPVTELLDKLFQTKLIESEHELSVVFVSSDKTQRAFEGYLRPGWKFIPYENEDERSNLKRHFHTCSKREMTPLGITARDYEIPHVIVLDTASESVLAIDGLTDLKQKQENALSYWQDLKQKKDALRVQTE